MDCCLSLNFTVFHDSCIIHAWNLTLEGSSSRPPVIPHCKKSTSVRKLCESLLATGRQGQDHDHGNDSNVLCKISNLSLFFWHSR